MTKVADLKKNKEDPKAGGTLVKELLSKTLGKSGKPSAIKLKIKFGGKGESKSKPKKGMSSNPATYHRP